MSEKLNDLERRRTRINEINAEMLRLLIERAQEAVAVGELKTDLDRPIYDPERENAVLEDMVRQNKAAEDSPLSGGDVEEFYATVMDICRRVQFPNHED